VARTAGDDVAAAEIAAMTSEASTVAVNFSTALDSAKLAAVIALPDSREAAPNQP
jgi:hypothetical protein